MDIKKIGSAIPAKTEKKNISTKKDFSESFNSERERHSEKYIKEIFENIKKKGKKLSITKSISDVNEYIKMIKDYLQFVTDYMYNIKKNTSFYMNQYFVTVDTVDKKCEELTQMIIDDQTENLNIASTIDEITGLLLDAYK